MELISVNVGKERSVQRKDRLETTGIFKTAVLGPVRILVLGLEGDFIGDARHHGGPDQAIYVYGTTDYEWWAGELGRQLEPGTFGENLTVEGLESAQLSIGDRLQVGQVTLQVTAPRIPCSTLAARMGDPLFVKRFRAAERPGCYCRVLAEGSVQAGDPVRVEPYAAETVTILEMFRDHYEKDQDEARLRLYLAAPIASRDRAEKEERLRKPLGRG